MTDFTIDLTFAAKLDDNRFAQLCAANPYIKGECTPKRKLVIMPPTGGETGKRGSELNTDFVIWTQPYWLGYVFDSSTCFRLRDWGADNRSADVSWVDKSRWEAFSAEDRRKIPADCTRFCFRVAFPNE